jgi:peptidoglycan/LPS O-acetylase OafA/YrhL
VEHSQKVEREYGPEGLRLFSRVKYSTRADLRASAAPLRRSGGGVTLGGGQLTKTSGPGFERRQATRPGSGPADRIGIRGPLPVLDGVRGVAILLVICYHSLQPRAGAHGVSPERLYTALASYGWCGVDLFFVLSGFLITRILLDSKDEPHYFRNFYARRTLRIFPLYYGALFLLFILARPMLERADSYQVALQHQAWYWTYSNNIWMSLTGASAGAFDHFWSLAVEEQFYVFWPLIVRYGTGRAILRWCIFFIGFPPLVRILCVLFPLPVQTHLLTICRMDALAMGALAAVLARNRPELWRLAGYTGPLAIGAIGGLAAMAIINRPLVVSDPSMQTLGLTLFAVLFGALLVFVLSLPARHLLIRWLEWGPLRFVGKVSYGIYVFHWFVVVELTSRWTAFGFPPGLGNQLAFLTAVLTISLLLATLSWYAYERRFLALKEYFVSPSHAKSVPPG